MMIAKLRKNAALAWKVLIGHRAEFYADYLADGMGVRYRNLDFLQDRAFDAAWTAISQNHAPFWNGDVPDIRWRMHVCNWAASNAMKIEGDFVELGVNTGLLSDMICRNFDLAKAGKKFWLFDTYSGIPEASASAAEIGSVKSINQSLYNQDVFGFVKDNFKKYPFVNPVKGILPGSLAGIPIEKISYLSIDLNVVQPEIESARILWDRLSPGALIVLDDYGFSGHALQYAAWNELGKELGFQVLTLPTGQGLIQKSP